MRKRLIAVDKTRSIEIKKLMKKTKNNTERKRIQILFQYLGWKNIAEVRASLQVSSDTVSKTIRRYEKLWDAFYKTNRKWRIESKDNKQLANQAKRYIDKKDHVDINEVRRELSRKNKIDIPYWKAHWLVRKKLWYNYQKPFVTSKKQHPYAKEIAEWRLRKAIYEVALEEWEIDGDCVKNKKIAIWDIEQ